MGSNHAEISGNKVADHLTVSTNYSVKFRILKIIPCRVK